MKKLLFSKSNIGYFVFLVLVLGLLLRNFLYSDSYRPQQNLYGAPKYSMENSNALMCWMGADGMSSHNPLTDNAGLIFPRGTASVVFQDGIVWGGYVNDSNQPALRVGGQTYQIGTVEGSILSPGVAEDPNSPNVRIWRIRPDFARANLRLEAIELGRTEEQIRNQYALDWAEWPWQKGAPFYDTGYLGANGITIIGAHNGVLDRGEDLNSNGILDPGEDANGNDILDGEFPGIADADQVTWTVANDLDSSLTNHLYGSPPIGLEMQITWWSYDQSPRFSLGFSTTIFKRIRLIYKGTNSKLPTATIDSMFISQWSDVAIGFGEDDLLGCDTIRGMGYGYNGYNQDSEFALFGLAPPAVGYDLVQGPLKIGIAGEDLNKNGIDDSQDYAIFNFKLIGPGFINLPMTSFGYTVPNQGIPDPQIGQYDGTLQWYNLLNGFRPTNDLQNPTPYIHGAGPNAGLPTRFPLASSPFYGSGDLDGTGNNYSAGERKLMISSGPFSMTAGDTQEVSFALIGGSSTDRISSCVLLTLASDFAQVIFDSLFHTVPKAPPPPLFSATGLDQKVVLTWDTSSEDYENLNFEFEGYNVYLSSSPYGPWEKMATFDIENNITTIRGYVFDPVYGNVIYVPIQNGQDTGLQHFFQLDTDMNGNPLTNGTTYYFSVTAYDYNPLFPTPSYECFPNPVSARPIGAAGGMNYSLAGVDSSVLHLSGNSTGRVLVDVINPNSLIDHTYQVNFEENTNNDLVWNLFDVDDNNTLLYHQSDLNGGPFAPIVDGLLVSVINPPAGLKRDDMFSTPDSTLWGWKVVSGELRFSWKGGANGFQFEAFRGAIGWSQPATLFGSGYNYPEENLKNVLLVLAQADTSGNFNIADPNVSYAYRYGRNFNLPPARPEFVPFIINTASGYSYQDFTQSIPLAAFDIDDPANPRRLVIGFLENNVSGGLVNGKWWPPDYHTADNFISTGPREWLWIFDADYSSTPDPNFQVELTGNELPIMYWLTVARNGNVAFSPNQSSEDQFAIYPNHTLTINDTFQFNINPPIHFTITKGDVNADSTIDVADVVKLINYILQKDTLSGEQQYAADFNSDLQINVTDLVGIINSILGIERLFSNVNKEESVEIGLRKKATVDQNILKVPLEILTDKEVAGIQIELNYPPKVLKPILVKFSSSQWNNSSVAFNSAQAGKVIYLFYNLRGKSLPIEDLPEFCFEILEDNNLLNLDVKLSSAIISNASGKSMLITYSNKTASVDLIPKTYEVYQNYPNPFNSSTTIRYDLPLRSKVTIEIYNVIGQKVKTLMDKNWVDKGRHRIRWDGLNNMDCSVSSGIYFIRFQANDFIKHYKVILLK